jgi:hypothetical protein
VVLHERERSIATPPPLGHVAFLAPDAGKGGHTLLERRIRAGHLRAITLGLLPRPLLGQTLEAVFTEGALDCLEHPDSELRVAVGKPLMGLGREPPQAGGPADLAPFVREVDELVSLQGGEMLANGHGGDMQALGHSRGSLGALGLEEKEDPFPPGAGSVRAHRGRYTEAHPVSQVWKVYA